MSIQSKITNFVVPSRKTKYPILAHKYQIKSYMTVLFNSADSGIVLAEKNTAYKIGHLVTLEQGLETEYSGWRILDPTEVVELRNSVD